jgi:hypothetical protein
MLPTDACMAAARSARFATLLMVLSNVPLSAASEYSEYPPRAAVSARTVPKLTVNFLPMVISSLAFDCPEARRDAADATG